MKILIVIIIFLSVFSVFLHGQEKKFNYSDFDNDIVAKDSLPLYFNLRNTGRLSPVKTQSNSGCWASAAMASVESFWRTQYNETAIMSDLNLKLYHGFDSTRTNNGNHYMATSYFSRRSGPLEKNPKTDSLYFKEPQTLTYITDAHYLPNDPKLVKQIILDYGSVYSMMHFRPDNLDTLTFVHNTNKKRINHAVNIVGWNDTLQADTTIGAWIAQNSLGERFADSGFFYIPYSDPNILEYNCIWPKWLDYEKNSKIYYYDTLGSYFSYGFRDTLCYGLVKYTAESDLRITKIGSFINQPFTKIYAEIYKEFDTTSKLLTKREAVIDEIQCKYPGYYTIDLKVPVSVDRDDDFYIMMKYVTPYDTLPLPVETFIEGYSDPHITSHTCWINPDLKKWPETWYECGTNSKFETLNFDLCIKAYCIIEED